MHPTGNDENVEYVFKGHAVQEEAPGVYRPVVNPAGHVSQLVAELLLLKVPTGHPLQLKLPAGEGVLMYPAGQDAHDTQEREL